MDLKSAADRLDVHYQTAYRWVRTGVLPAVKVAGSYDIAAADIDRFLARRAAPAPPAKATVRRWENHVDRLVDDLLANRELQVQTAVGRLHAAGVHSVDICQSLLTPALERVGDLWARGAISVADEHQAAAICERVVARIADYPPGRPRGVAVVATPPGESHHLPALMATVALRADRWRVHHLGVDVPPADVIGLFPRLDVRLVVLSTIYPGAQADAAALAEAYAAAGPAVLVGGPGRTLTELLSAARSVG